MHFDYSIEKLAARFWVRCCCAWNFSLIWFLSSFHKTSKRNFKFKFIRYNKILEFHMCL